MPMVRFLADMTFDGQVLKQGVLKFKATSGLPGYQFPKHQCIKVTDQYPRATIKSSSLIAAQQNPMGVTSASCRLHGVSRKFPEALKRVNVRIIGQIGVIIACGWSRQTWKRNEHVLRSEEGFISTTQ